MTLANLKPWPEQGEARMTWGRPGYRSMMKCSSGVLVKMQVFQLSSGPLASGK